MPALRPDIDPDGLREYSVVYTDRSLNHMSAAFQNVMRTLSAELKNIYNADALALVPGGGTYAMEAIARQIATDKKVLVIRNGWFSFRWSQILETGQIPAETIVMKARRAVNDPQAPFAPAPIEDVVKRIAAEKPGVVFAPHVETSSGMILPDDYLKQVAEAARKAGAVFVLDCIASGCVWIDIKDIGVDFLISAPQKGWSASPAAGVVMLSERGREMVKASRSTSFACDLGKWLEIMEAYEAAGHAYHATMPTDALRQFMNAVLETKEHGFDAMKSAQWELGRKVCSLLKSRGFPSVVAEGFEAPGVVVSYTDDPDIRNGSKFAAEGVQIAAGVPLQCDEPEGFSTFRIGLFGLDKLTDVDGAVARLEATLDRID